MAENEDKRILKTKKLIKDTFFKILEEKDFEKITISEIADKALISKGTFYYHYEDKYDFVQKLVDEMIEEYTKIMNKRTKNKKVLSNDDMSELILFITTKLFPDYRLIKKIHISGLDFRGKLETLMANEIEKIINERSDIKVSDTRIVARIIAAMQITLGDELIEKGEPISAEKNLKTIHDIISTFKILFF